MPTWSDLASPDLTPRQLHDLLRLRNLVFVVEQECAYPDIDGLDLAPTTRHLLASDADKVVACSRLLPEERAIRVGRIVVAAEHRGTGLGRELVRRSLTTCSQHWAGRPVLIAAQAHLSDFYGEFGFEVSGAPYLEDGIRHVDMVRAAARA